jgi:hypothetical protein
MPPTGNLLVQKYKILTPNEAPRTPGSRRQQSNAGKNNKKTKLSNGRKPEAVTSSVALPTLLVCGRGRA